VAQRLAALRRLLDLLRTALPPGTYEQLYPLVRRINQRLPRAKKLRVLAPEPPIDWSKVTSPADFYPFLDDRDQHIASVLESEVLSKRRKALILMGTGHLRHGTGAAGIYEQTYPNSTFVITGHLGFAKDNDELERRMASWPVPSLATFQGTWLGELDSFTDSQRVSALTELRERRHRRLRTARPDHTMRQIPTRRAATGGEGTFA
jgi:hypothetical protein